MTLDELVSQLRAAYGPALRSIVLYGFRRGRRALPKRSDYNVPWWSTHSTRRNSPRPRPRRAPGLTPAIRAAHLTTSEWRGSRYLPMSRGHFSTAPRLFGASVAGIDRASRTFAPLEQEAMGNCLKAQGVLAAGNDASARPHCSGPAPARS